MDKSNTSHREEKYTPRQTMTVKQIKKKKGRAQSI